MRSLSFSVLFATLSMLAGCGGPNIPSTPAETITVVAGNGNGTYTGDGGPATGQGLNGPWGIALDSSGNLYIADAANFAVRKVDAVTGDITTVAGTGVYGYSGDNGPATAAKLGNPWGVALDSANNVYISDRANEVIRKVSSSTGIITTIAGTGATGSTGDGGPATSATFNYIQSIAVDSSGNLYAAEDAGLRVRKIAAGTGIISTVAGGGTSLLNNVPATTARIQPDGLGLDASGNLYIGDRMLESVREVNLSTGIITTVAGNGTFGDSGDGGPATSAELATPSNIAFHNGAMYNVNYGNGSIRKVDLSTGIISSITVSGQFNCPDDLVFSPSTGALYVTDTCSRLVSKITNVP